MLVQVKDGCTGFWEGKRRRPAEVFEWPEGKKLSSSVVPVMPDPKETAKVDAKRVKTIAEALGKLTQDSAEAWCAAPPGLVKLDWLMKSTGLDNITRKEVEAIAPKLNRETAPKGEKTAF